MIQERCKCCGAVMPDQDKLKLLDLDTVIRFVVQVTGIPHARMLAPPKTQDVIRAKHLVYYFAYYYTKTKIKDIATIVGNATHATVLYGCQRTDFNIKWYFEIRDAVHQVMKLIVDGGFLVHRQEFRLSPREINTNEI